MKITIGRKPKRKVMLFYFIQCLLLSIILLAAVLMVTKFNIIGLLAYLVVTVGLILFVQVYYLSSIKYWELDDNHLNYVMPEFRGTLIKEIKNAFVNQTIQPTLSLTLDELDAIAIDVRFYVYMGFKLKEPHLHMIFALKDGSTISMFAGDGQYQEEMKQLIGQLIKKNITIIDPYHLLDGEINHLYDRIGQFSW